MLRSHSIVISSVHDFASSETAKLKCDGVIRRRESTKDIRGKMLGAFCARNSNKWVVSISSSILNFFRLIFFRRCYVNRI